MKKNKAIVISFHFNVSFNVSTTLMWCIATHWFSNLLDGRFHKEQYKHFLVSDAKSSTIKLYYFHTNNISMNLGATLRVARTFKSFLRSNSSQLLTLKNVTPSKEFDLGFLLNDNLKLLSEKKKIC